MTNSTDSPTAAAQATAPLSYSERLAALRSEIEKHRIDGFIVPISDEHMSEYVGSYAKRLEWLTGFGGSAGTAVVCADSAAIFVDGRYVLQVREQVDGSLYDYQTVPDTSIADWLAVHGKEGMRIGYDSWLHTLAWARSTSASLAELDIELVAVTDNPIDAIWQGQPPRSTAPARLHDMQYAGQSAHDKRAMVAAWLEEQQADTVIICALDSLAWAFNLRGSDIAHTPVVFGFALLHRDGSADLFVDSDKLGNEVRAALDSNVQTHDYNALLAHIAEHAPRRIAVDPERTAAAIAAAVGEAGAAIIETRDPTILPRAIKNPTEIAGARAAHIIDDIALVRFLHWLDEHAPTGEVDELRAAAKLREFREESGCLRDLSFDTISAAGPNGAQCHYRVNEASNRSITMDSLYLVDSGGQYEQGTTDITRTIAIGTPTAEMKRRFTQVLKGHIALARARFPVGTCGGQLDSLARQFLWADGVDYAHGTGHGVGSYLGVHEGPQRIAKYSGGQAGSDEPIVAGMIFSNEPGYYKAGEFGIRIENLVLAKSAEVEGAEMEVLELETLSFAPIDQRLIEASLLSASEIEWLDTYHAAVVEKIAPHLDEETRAWLERACAPM